MGDHQEQPQGRSGSDGLHPPPGFRFYPKDEEIITFYLIPKVHQRNFTCTAIGEVDFNRTEPWELPGMHSLHIYILFMVQGHMLMSWHLNSVVRQGKDGGEGLVLLLSEGPQAPNGDEDEPGHEGRLLEGHGQGQRDL